MDQRVETLEGLRAVLHREEAVLADLLRSADMMRDALIASDFALLDSASKRMDAAGDDLETLEQERDELVEALGEGVKSLHDVVRIAETIGMAGFDRARERLAGAAFTLKEAQERNASLILGAARLRERWFNLLAGMASPTYGAGGRQQMRQRRGFVSKSA